MKLFYKKIESVARSVYDDIYNIYWDRINNKIKIVGLEYIDFPIFDFVDLYYDFLKSESEFDKTNKIPETAIEKMNIVVEVVKHGGCYISYDKDYNIIKGFVQYEILENIKTVRIKTIFTNKDYLHQHIGRDLMRFVERRMVNKLDIRKIRVYCCDENVISHTFYKSMGYNEITEE